MSFYYAKVLSLPFDQAVQKVSEALKEVGFGIITEISIHETLKKKIDVDFRKYKILGACNPNFSYQALQADDKVGLLLPCNVVIQEIAEDVVEISTMKPTEMLKIIDNPEVKQVANKVKAKLEQMINSLE